MTENIRGFSHSIQTDSEIVPYIRPRNLPFISFTIHYSLIILSNVVPWIRRLVTDLSPRWPGFAHGSVHVGFVLDKVVLGHVFLWVLLFYLSISFHRGSPYSYIIWRTSNWSVSGRSSKSETQSHPIDMNNHHIIPINIICTIDSVLKYKENYW
jgi:hypothetical protein